MQVGLTFQEYEDITPYELGVKVEAYNQNFENERKLIAYGAWLTAKLSKAQKIPDFNKLIPTQLQRGKSNKFRMKDYEIDIHFNRFKQEGRLLLIG